MPGDQCLAVDFHFRQLTGEQLRRPVIPHPQHNQGVKVPHHLRGFGRTADTGFNIRGGLGVCRYLHPRPAAFVNERNKFIAHQFVKFITMQVNRQFTVMTNRQAGVHAVFVNLPRDTD
ncbi:hypothetical protein Xinn_04182 [Xenorhabdus innexi]|uniref:Transposase n=1 Tax=Xenorhabdus innexi TaxID=290109 RepID=A0A2G0MHJ0_9GAMM|nr:hypothetical protein Xinn_04182 [Xenorhabdus innexi]